MQRPQPSISDSSIHGSNLTASADLMPKTKSSVLNQELPSNTESCIEKSDEKKLKISKQRSEKASLQPRNSLGQFVKSNKIGQRHVNNWVEFQKEHRGKYTRSELSKMYKEQKLLNNC